MNNTTHEKRFSPLFITFKTRVETILVFSFFPTFRTPRIKKKPL